ncbi:hypothetical protein GCM10008090_30820 [Arenicella chitinivorans]|uniref:Uncharacterized protein n=1 Tax=Arenicella chitinivorans TaxID=1329800 RepID=A0A918S3J2_9GAMM|nr:hypothetical protein [Arenicella chitinivorans]GHA18968.1 hypothetical protein GCM10008090_30820 [Arenicella chitinivorans]
MKENSTETDLKQEALLSPQTIGDDVPKAIAMAIESVTRDPDPTLSHYDFSDHTNHN